MWNHTQGTPTLRYCIICIKSAIYNEMCRDAQGYTGKGTMSLYFRPLRNPLIHSQLHSSWLFSCAADGELAHRTTCTETDTRAVRPDGCESKGCPDPRGRPRDAASVAPRNLVHPHIVLSPNSRTSAPPMDIQNAPPRAPRADIGQWRTATTRTAHGSGISVRLFDEERYRGLHSRSS